jgi:RND family efflux transporter MFP subunit
VLVGWGCVGMSHTRWLVLLGTGLALILILTCTAPPLAGNRLLSRTGPSVSETPSLRDPELESLVEQKEPARTKIDGAVIRAWRQATVASEVQGVIEKRYGKEGDIVGSGTVVFEISPELFGTLVQRARERLAWQAAAREESDQELRLKEELIALDATTMPEIVKAKSAAQMATHKEREANLDLELAIRDMKKCKVRAPFTGILVSFHRDAYESVQRFEQLFLIADTSKVYAVANVPQSFFKEATPGGKASFLAQTGAVFPGTVDKVDATIDPASQTRKVYILIENSEARLEMGMLGQVIFVSAHRKQK